MKKIFNLVLAVLLINTANIYAQVTIGSQNDPHAGAVLDLQSNGIRGLLLPKVSLTSTAVWSPVTGTAIDGMMVYNTSTSTANGLSGQGVYVWSANKWSKNSDTETINPYLSGVPADWVTVNPTPNGGDGSYANPYKNTCPGTTVGLTPKPGYTFGEIAPVSAASVFGNVVTFTGSGSIILKKDGQVGAVYVAINNCSFPVTDVSVSPVTATLTAVGQTQQLTATISPSNATNKNISWSSNNTAVATVSSTGLVTAVSGGVATITVMTEDGGKSAISTITVNIPVSGVSVSPTSSTLASIGQTLQLVATISPSNATNKNVTWISSDATVATVSSTGLVTAKSSGTAVITVTTVDGSKTATCTIMVGLVVDNIVLSEATITTYAENIVKNNPNSLCASGYRIASSKAEAIAIAKTSNASAQQTWYGATYTPGEYMGYCSWGAEGGTYYNMAQNYANLVDKTGKETSTVVNRYSCNPDLMVNLTITTRCVKQ